MTFPLSADDDLKFHAAREGLMEYVTKSAETYDLNNEDTKKSLRDKTTSNQVSPRPPLPDPASRHWGLAAWRRAPKLPRAICGSVPTPRDKFCGSVPTLEDKIVKKPNLEDKIVKRGRIFFEQITPVSRHFFLEQISFLLKPFFLEKEKRC